MGERLTFSKVNALFFLFTFNGTLDAALAVLVMVQHYGPKMKRLNKRPSGDLAFPHLQLTEERRIGSWGDEDKYGIFFPILLYSKENETSVKVVSAWADQIKTFPCACV